MASIRPLTQNGGATLLANVRYSQVDLMVNNGFVNTTGTKAGVSDTIQRACESMSVVEVLGRGAIETDADSRCAKAQIGFLTAGGILIQPQKWSLRRLWALEDVTGSDGFVPDQEKRWQSGLGRLMGGANGWVRKGGPVHATQRSPLGLKIDLVGEIAIQDAQIKSLTTRNAHTRGGVYRAAFNFETDAKGGGYTLTPEGTNFTSVLDPSLDEPLTDDITIDFDTGQVITHRATLYDLNFTNPSVRGGPVHFSGRWRFNVADPAAPGTPANFGATGASGQVNLSWDALAGDHTYFFLQRRIGAGPWEGVASIKPDQTSYADTRVVAGTSYTYQLVAGNAADTATSATSSATPS